MGNAKYPPKPEGCTVQVFPSTAPDYKWEDIATVKAECHQTRGRNACIEELKSRTCELGGDTLYGLKDGVDREAAVVIATVAVRTGLSAPAPVLAPASPQVTGDECSPPCSPGYACSNGQCIAVCNPPCGNGMHCNQQRICEPVRQ